MDFGIDTCCAGKHDWVTDFKEGVSILSRGLSDSLPIEYDLPLANVIYAYDCATWRKTILLHINLLNLYQK